MWPSFDPGQKVARAIGPNSNVAENGIDKEQGRAAIWEIDLKTGGHRTFASGLRNPRLRAGDLRAMDSGKRVRELGSDLPPDYMTAVREWRILRLALQLLRPARRCTGAAAKADLVAKAFVPDYALGAHRVAGTCSGDGEELSPQFESGMFVGQNGALLVADDVGNTIWRVTAEGDAQRTAAK